MSAISTNFRRIFFLKTNVVTNFWHEIWS
jgi:hypothetical protein